MQGATAWRHHEGCILSRFVASNGHETVPTKHDSGDPPGAVATLNPLTGLVTTGRPAGASFCFLRNSVRNGS